MVPKGCQFTIPWGLIGTPLKVQVCNHTIVTQFNQNYLLVNEHSNGKSTIWKCFSYQKWWFSIAMLVLPEGRWIEYTIPWNPINWKIGKSTPKPVPGPCAFRRCISFFDTSSRTVHTCHDGRTNLHLGIQMGWEALNQNSWVFLRVFVVVHLEKGNTSWWLNWTKPFEKYARQIGSISPNRGKNKKSLKPPPRLQLCSSTKWCQSQSHIVPHQLTSATNPTLLHHQPITTLPPFSASKIRWHDLEQYLSPQALQPRGIARPKPPFQGVPIMDDG